MIGKNIWAVVKFLDFFWMQSPSIIYSFLTASLDYDEVFNESKPDNTTVYVTNLPDRISGW